METVLIRQRQEEALHNAGNAGDTIDTQLIQAGFSQHPQLTTKQCGLTDRLFQVQRRHFQQLLTGDDISTDTGAIAYPDILARRA